MGSMSAQDFLDRVLVAQAVSPADAGVPSTEYMTQGGMTDIDCGRSEGYSDRRLDQLREVAEFGVNRGRDIQWG